MFRLFTMFSRTEWLLLALAGGLIVFGVWMDLEVPKYLREITMVATGEVYGATTGYIWYYGGLMLAFGLGSMATAIIVSWIGAYVSSSHANRMRGRMFEQVGKFGAAEMKKFGVPSLITRNTNDINNVRLFTALAVQMLIRAPVTAIWAITEVTTTSWELSVVAVVAVVALLVVMGTMIIIGLPKFLRVQKLTDDINKVARENLSGIRVVRAYNAGEHEEEKFTEVNQGLRKVNTTVNRILGIFWPFIGFLMSMLTVGIYWVGSWIIDAGRTDNPGAFFGDMMVFSQYATMIIFSFLMVVMVMVFFPRAYVSGKRVWEVLSTKPSIVGGETTPIVKSSDVVFNNVNFVYPGAEKNVLDDINITIKEGQTVAFIGGTGCGKSTLVNLLPRIYDATGGEIKIGDACVRDMGLESLNDIVGYVPQTATIFAGTIRSNIEMGKAMTDDEIWRALEISQAKEFVEKVESKLGHEVGAGGKNLSGGQKQRLSIARVVARKPKIYIFDDTFSALDYRTDSKLRAALAKNLENETMLIVAQRVGTIRDVDKIFVMEDGKIVSQGTHKELMKGCKVYREIATSQGVKDV